MRKNADSILPLVRLAEAWGIEVGFSCYSRLKTNDESNAVAKKQLSQFHQIVETICEWEKKRRIIKSSRSHLRKIPEYFEKGKLGTCEATKTWLYIAPDGCLKICPDKSIYAHYKDYAGSLNIACGDCWYTCRGEMETPFFERFFWEVRNRKKYR